MRIAGMDKEQIRRALRRGGVGVLGLIRAGMQAERCRFRGACIGLDLRATVRWVRAICASAKGVPALGAGTGVA